MDIDASECVDMEMGFYGKLNILSELGNKVIYQLGIRMWEDVLGVAVRGEDIKKVN